MWRANFLPIDHVTLLTEFWWHSILIPSVSPTDGIPSVGLRPTWSMGRNSTCSTYKCYTANVCNNVTLPCTWTYSVHCCAIDIFISHDLLPSDIAAQSVVMEQWWSNPKVVGSIPTLVRVFFCPFFCPCVCSSVGLTEFAFWSTVTSRGSKNYWKLFSNYLLTSSIQKFTGSCLLEFPVPVFAAFGSYFCLSKTFTFPPILWGAEHQNMALSIITVKLFFFRIIAEDKTGTGGSSKHEPVNFWIDEVKK